MRYRSVSIKCGELIKTYTAHYPTLPPLSQGKNRYQQLTLADTKKGHRIMSVQLSITVKRWSTQYQIKIDKAFKIVYICTNKY